MLIPNRLLTMIGFLALATLLSSCSVGTGGVHGVDWNDPADTIDRLDPWHPIDVELEFMEWKSVQSVGGARCETFVPFGLNFGFLRNAPSAIDACVATVMPPNITCPSGVICK